MGAVARTGLAEVNEYRAYVVGDDGYFLTFRAFRCADDSEAITWAKQMVDGHDVELWSGERFILRIDHKKPRQSEQY
jgi:hypothetical protein